MNTGLASAIERARKKQRYTETALHKVLREDGGHIDSGESKSKFKVAEKQDRTSYDNILFDSKLEMVRYEMLLLLQKAGKISDLEIQKEFLLLEDAEYNGKKERGIRYFADFYYFDREDSHCFVVEEWKVKATKTKDYRLKRKLFLQRYPNIEFREMVGDKEGIM